MSPPTEVQLVVTSRGHGLRSRPHRTRHVIPGTAICHTSTGHHNLHRHQPYTDSGLRRIEVCHQPTNQRSTAVTATHRHGHTAPVT
jgi:hypothetical protein